MNNKRLSLPKTGALAPNFCLPSFDGPSLDGPTLDGPTLDGPTLDGPSLHGRVCLSDFAGRRHVLLFFMPRFTSSVAWRGAIALARLQKTLQKENTIVLLIGRGGYLRPATRLAAELGLPFRVLADEEGTAACRYGLDEKTLAPPAGAAVLVDKWGIVRHADIGALPDPVLDISRLTRAVRRLATQRPVSPPAPWLYQPVELAACGC